MPPARTVEFEIKAWHLILALILIGAGGGAFFLLRPAPGEKASPRGTSARTAGGKVEDLHRGGSVFDQEGGSQAERDPTRQVTRERLLTGRVELDLGAVPSRGEAEQVRRWAASLKIPVSLAAEESRYRLVAGPFPTETAAREAARKLEQTFGLKSRLRWLQEGR